MVSLGLMCILYSIGILVYTFHEVIFLNEKNCVPSMYEANTEEENIWYLDNGARNHMTGDIRYFQHWMIQFQAKYISEMTPVST